MVAHFTMRTYEANQEFRFAEGIWSNRKGVKSDFCFWKRPFFTSYMCNMFWATILYKNHAYYRLLKKQWPILFTKLLHKINGSILLGHTVCFHIKVSAIFFFFFPYFDLRLMKNMKNVFFICILLKDQLCFGVYRIKNFHLQ